MSGVWGITQCSARNKEGDRLSKIPPCRRPEWSNLQYWLRSLPFWNSNLSPRMTSFPWDPFQLSTAFFTCIHDSEIRIYISSRFELAEAIDKQPLSIREISITASSTSSRLPGEPCVSIACLIIVDGGRGDDASTLFSAFFYSSMAIARSELHTLKKLANLTHR